MSPLKTCTYLTLARLFDWIRPPTPDQYSRPFPIGRGTLTRGPLRL